jgi:Zn-dependent M28 family amino/carboxypeptidase
MLKTMLIIGVLLMGFACKPNPQNAVQNNENSATIFVPEFNADSAYHYTATQVAFGPRVPNTQAHVDCGNYFTEEFRRFGAKVIEQEVTLYTYNKQAIQAKNIIVSFDSENTNRVLLFAHWDSRPFADNDPDPANHRTAVDGANDGAGASAVLMEIARQIGIQAPNIGIDIILFDAEDWGDPLAGGWCLGSEYWAKNPHIPNYIARYGILLDMVSAPNAQFYREYYSDVHAKNIVDKVWRTAHSLGHHSFFINEPGGAIVDDHLEVIKYRRIPCINIIDFDPNRENGFGDYWHTINDTMDAISKETMKAVGQTVLHVIYNEK